MKAQRCRRCGETKHIEEFARARYNGRWKVCRQCFGAGVSARHAENRRMEEKITKQFAAKPIVIDESEPNPLLDDALHFDEDSHHWE